MTAYLSLIPRDEKRDITVKVRGNLIARQLAGPPEPGLDAFIPELDAVAQSTSLGVAGGTATEAERTALLAALDGADVDVDTWLRHIEGFIRIEAHRRSGPNVVAAQALHKTAFSDGLEHVDDPIDEENRHCRTSLDILRSRRSRSRRSGSTSGRRRSTRATRSTARSRWLARSTRRASAWVRKRRSTSTR